ncbi:putative 3-demethylubiquinone-9 3-methyltransferase (glyoxalase superfamily) [Brevibacillus brevis]|nr:putative 3-demethylubiquinone-9 3-methyltransferase (glyoxalase superfamily) [Brevibacillus brevis]TQK45684.1 putative 3-demethylubiquinone-9 3-methyltransferase (glyoxalase superfamily) [Brevibacillus sp. AG162]GEC89598.1 VOC family protein [Brevibacillus brevis]VEF87523.1 3-demethylubiquinone-9 3-methyltransferase [Brevibacillus brevis]
MQAITTFFMFHGKAEEAMKFYTSIFERSEIKQVMHHENGQVLHATFTLKDQTFMCIDNTNGDYHAFTPAISLFVDCDTEEEVDRVFGQLSSDGQVLMPLGQLPFSEKFGWVQDRYGISWQINLPKK